LADVSQPHALALISALAQLGWEYMPSIALPIVLKATMPHITTDAADAAFLATLAAQGLLHQAQAPLGFAAHVVAALQRVGRAMIGEDEVRVSHYAIRRLR
jgi:hypothetical protein